MERERDIFFGDTMSSCEETIPESVIAEMIMAGCTQEEVSGESPSLRTRVGSPAWKVYADWASELGEVDPAMLPFWDPPPQNPPAQAGLILSEVASVITHCAHMNMQSFAMGPPGIPLPLAAPQLPIFVHHARVAVTGIVERIQNPPRNYPTLSNLGSGSYICDIEYRWTRATVVVAIYKP